MQSSCNEENNIVNHVSVGDEVHEAGHGSSSMVAHVLELGDQLLPQLVVNDRHLKTALVGQEIAIISGLEVKLQVIQSLALHQVQIIILG